MTPEYLILTPALRFEIVHGIQLNSYGYLFRQATHDIEGGLEIRSLVKTKSSESRLIAIRRGPIDILGRLLTVIRAYLDNLDSGRFVFRPGLGCSMCDFRDSFCSQCARWAKGRCDFTNAEACLLSAPCLLRRRPSVLFRRAPESLAMLP